jgi:hypothetical protein
MAETAADLLRAGAGRGSDGISGDSAGWSKNPRPLADRLRRAQTFLRVLRIDIAFSREGRAEASGCVPLSKIPSARSAAPATMDPGLRQPPPRPAGDVCDAVFLEMRRAS